MIARKIAAVLLSVGITSVCFATDNAPTVKPILIVVVGDSMAASYTKPPDMRIRKKLIATGWDHPDSPRLLANLAEMEKRPFDGVVIEVTGQTAEGKPCPLCSAFSNQKWQREWFQTSVAQFRNCKFTRFTDNFITIGANPGNIDWFDDEGWQRIVEHWRIAAWIAKQERTRISERTKAGLQVARHKGKILGRPFRVFPRGRVLADRKRGMSWPALERKYGIPQATIRRAVKRLENEPKPGLSKTPPKPICK